MEVTVRDFLDVSPGDHIASHAQRDLGQEVGMELALAVYRDHIRVLNLKDYAEYCSYNK